MTLQTQPVRWSSYRSWIALAILIAVYFATSGVVSFFYHKLAHNLHVHGSALNTLGRDSYALSMVISLTWNVVSFALICTILRRSPFGFPITDSRIIPRGLRGLATGLAVMFGVMMAIWATGAASVSYSDQSASSALQNGSFWLMADYVGAIGEELFGRGTVLIVAERLLGWQGAILVSGVVFSVQHLGNPGASWIWLLRLFLQGMLLAYAVFRTRSLWWSVGYHAGWNWVSAPLFGAAGSGYLDEGHIFDFLPHGSQWLTGGPVGPEGSFFAFVAVLAAFSLLLITTSETDRLRRT